MSRGFHSVVFDCDSTLVTIEGIDQLAGPRAAEIRAMTDAAMAGEARLEEVYGRRLALIRPTRAAVERLGDAYVRALVPYAAATVGALRWLGKTVRIVSGGLLPPVLQLAEHLAIPAAAVAAVPVHFTDGGEYAGFDDASPLARAGGKQEVIERWALPRPVLLVGDGATDLEAHDAVDGFAAFTAVSYHASVAAAADVVLSGLSLAPVLSLAADEADRARLTDSPWRDLLERGDRELPASVSQPL